MLNRRPCDYRLTVWAQVRSAGRRLRGLLVMPGNSGEMKLSSNLVFAVAATENQVPVLRRRWYFDRIKVEARILGR